MSGSNTSRGFKLEESRFLNAEFNRRVLFLMLQYWRGLNLAIYVCTYDLYGPVRNDFDAGASITRASGRGLGPGNRDFFGPCEIASSR